MKGLGRTPSLGDRRGFMPPQLKTKNTTFLSLSLHSEIAGRFRAHDLNFWLTSSKRPSLLALLQL